MNTVISKDGTRIAYDRIGAGPAVILVNGALVYRDFWGHGPLAALLADQFTVYTYDRRGRGESVDAAQEFQAPLALEREIEDLAALIADAGGSAFLYGDSSGGALVLEAAIRLGDKVRKLAIYEVPYVSDETGRQAWRGYTKQLGEQLAADRRGGRGGALYEVDGRDRRTS
jgi:pimeloyl-ACP methyl ester carboxylesterase